MAVTTEYSTQYNGPDRTIAMTSLAPVMFRKVVIPFDFTQGSAAGDATSTARIFRLPPGLVYFFPKESYIQWSDMGSSPELDIGYGAYKTLAGVAVVADDNLFDDAIDASSAGEALMGSDYGVGTAGATGMYKKFETLEGVDIIVSGPDEGIPAAATLGGYLTIGLPN